jgi:hypothetical protein
MELLWAIGKGVLCLIGALAFLSALGDGTPVVGGKKSWKDCKEKGPHEPHAICPCGHIKCPGLAGPLPVARVVEVDRRKPVW